MKAAKYGVTKDWMRVERLTVRIDVAVWADSSRETEEVSLLEEFAKLHKLGVRVDVIAAYGPAGDWPEIQLSGPKTIVAKWLEEHYYELGDYAVVKPR